MFRPALVIEATKITSVTEYNCII